MSDENEPRGDVRTTSKQMFEWLRAMLMEHVDITTLVMPLHIYMMVENAGVALVVVEGTDHVRWLRDDDAVHEGRTPMHLLLEDSAGYRIALTFDATGNRPTDH